MNFMSLFSGIEAASVAWSPMGWKALSFAEIDPFASAVLSHRYPGVPNLGDVTKFKEWPDARPDLICAGSPCQSFSVAGLRAGLDDPRGNLALVTLAIVERFRPRWFIFENVPGLLSTDGGRAFGAFLGALGKLGYGWTYRVIDAQFCRVDGYPHAVPQRRRRVFVVGHLGDWRRAAAVLFEPESLRGNPPTRRQAGEVVAPTLSARTRGGGGLGTDFDCDGGLIADGPRWPASVAPTLNAHFGEKQGLEDQHALGGGGLFVAHAFDARQSDVVQYGEITGPLDTDGTSIGVMTARSVALRGREGGATIELGGDVAGTVRASQGGGDKPHVLTHAVRRITPREAERLQGFPDDWTLVPYRGKAAADGPRYKAIGNSWAVNVARWVGRRIEVVEGIK